MTPGSTLHKITEAATLAALHDLRAGREWLALMGIQRPAFTPEERAAYALRAAELGKAQAGRDR